MARQAVFKRARRTVDKQKKKVILQYMREHPDLVLNSSVTVIKGLKLSLRLKFALDILLGNKRRRRTKAYMNHEEVTPETTQEQPEPGNVDKKP